MKKFWDLIDAKWQCPIVDCPKPTFALGATKSNGYRHDAKLHPKLYATKVALEKLRRAKTKCRKKDDDATVTVPNEESQASCSHSSSVPKIRRSSNITSCTDNTEDKLKDIKPEINMIPTIPKLMLAAVVVEHGQPLQIKEVPVPTPQSFELLVKLEVSGVCHTDVHVQTGDWKVKCPLPMIPGHEGVGTVVSMGDGLSQLNLNSKIKIGDRVTVPWLHSSCGQCEHCWGGWETVCGAQRRTGFTFNGTFAEYCIVDCAFAIPVPDNLSSEQAAVISCAGVTVYKALKVSEVHPGQWVVVVGGSGNLGHVAIQYAKAMGMRVIGVDCGVAKGKFMMELGCDATVDVLGEDVVAKIKLITGGAGAHGALIIAPVSKAVGEAVKYMRPRGTVVNIGLPPGNSEFDIFDLVLNAITIRGSIVGTRLDLQEALNLAVDGKIVCKIRKRKFQDIQEVLEDLKSGKVEGCVAVDIP